MNLWSEPQQRWLEAMGYTVWVQPSVTLSDNRALPRPSVCSPMPSDTLLMQALVRAAAGADISGLAVDVPALRQQPMQKRLLWPRLRMLLRNR